MTTILISGCVILTALFYSIGLMFTLHSYSTVSNFSKPLKVPLVLVADLNSYVMGRQLAKLALLLIIKPINLRHALIVFYWAHANFSACAQ